MNARDRMIRDLGTVCLEAGWSDVPGDLGDLLDGLTRAGWRPPRDPAEIQVMCPECKRGYHINHPARPDMGACSEGACDCDWMDPYGVIRTAEAARKPGVPLGLLQVLTDDQAAQIRQHGHITGYPPTTKEA